LGSAVGYYVPEIRNDNWDSKRLAEFILLCAASAGLIFIEMLWFWKSLRDYLRRRHPGHADKNEGL